MRINPAAAEFVRLHGGDGGVVARLEFGGGEGRRVGFRVDPRALRDPVHPRHPGNAASPRFTVK